ncbi:hypothetical protein GOB99_05660 [Sinorhizobium meliloti]|nr:hypothetical protein [Sinorhizobium meliloti]MDX0236494.1 hypothetical protein [Sinorhizobium meliloti]
MREILQRIEASQRDGAQPAALICIIMQLRDAHRSAFLLAWTRNLQT